jgi:pyruvate,water dikinase
MIIFDLGSFGNIESANVPEMMREMAKLIFSCEKDQEFLKVESINGVKWLQENCAAAFELYQKFIERHGHRGLKEFDLLTKTWGMQPEKVIEMIQANLKFGIQETTAKEFDADKILNNLKTPLSDRGKKFLGKIIPKYHKAVQRREETKSILISGVNELRRAFTYLGRRMVNEGFLPDKELIFHLTYREIQTVIKTRNSRLIQNAIRRQKVYEKLNELKFPEVMFGVPKPISERSANFEVDGDVLARG